MNYGTGEIHRKMYPLLLRGIRNRKIRVAKNNQKYLIHYDGILLVVCDNSPSGYCSEKTLILFDIRCEF